MLALLDTVHCCPPPSFMPLKLPPLPAIPFMPVSKWPRPLDPAAPCAPLMPRRDGKRPVPSDPLEREELLLEAQYFGVGGWRCA